MVITLQCGKCGLRWGLPQEGSLALDQFLAAVPPCPECHGRLELRTIHPWATPPVLSDLVEELSTGRRVVHPTVAELNALLVEAKEVNWETSEVVGTSRIKVDALSFDLPERSLRIEFAVSGAGVVIRRVTERGGVRNARTEL